MRVEHRADQSLDQIVQRDQAGGAPVFLHQNRDLNPLVLHPGEQGAGVDRLRHQQGGLHDVAQGRLRLRLRGREDLDQMHDTLDLIEVAGIDREAGVVVLDADREGVVERRLDRDTGHFGAGDHDVARRHLVEREGPLDDLLGLGAHQSRRAAGRDQVAQLLDRVNALFLAHRL